MSHAIALARTALSTAIASLAVSLALVIVTAGCEPGAASRAPSPTAISTPQPTDVAQSPYRKPVTPEEIATAEKIYQEDVERRGGIIPASGPETAGATIELRDRTLTLPEDAYIGLFTTNIACIAELPCPAVPLHMIVRGQSSIEIDFDGNVIYEDIEPGEEGIFDSILEDLQREPESRSSAAILSTRATGVMALL